MVCVEMVTTVTIQGLEARLDKRFGYHLGARILPRYQTIKPSIDLFKLDVASNTGFASGGDLLLVPGDNSRKERLKSRPGKDQ